MRSILLSLLLIPLAVGVGRAQASFSSGGTVTNRTGALNSGQVIIGNGSGDAKADAGCSTDGAGNLTCKSYISAPGANFVFDGDSLTAGIGVATGANSYPSQAAALPAFLGRGTVTDIAVAGQTCENVAAGYATNAHPLSPAATGKPGYYFMMCGTNDIGHGSFTPASTFAEIQTIWADAVADGFTVIAYTVPYHEDTSANIQQMDQLNALLRGATPGSFSYLVDLNIILPDPFDQNYFQSDGTHPTTEGNTVIARNVNDALSYRGSGRFSQSQSHYLTFGTGNENTRLGEVSLYSLTTGSDNTAGGFNSVAAATTGSDNTGYGFNSLLSVNTGTQNTCVGSLSCGSLTNQSGNTVVGYNALSTGTGTNNTAVGTGALYGATGTTNSALGAYAGDAITSGQNNTCNGQNSCSGLATGNNDVSIGTNSAIGSAISNASALGYGASAGFTQCTAVGYGATCTAANQVVLGTSAEKIAIPGIVNSYDGLALAGLGHPVVLGTLDETGISTANSGSAQSVLASTPSAGHYRLLYYVDQSAGCTTVGSGALTVTAGWTDATHARASSNQTLTPSTADTGTSSYLTQTVDFWSAAADAVTVTATYTACGSGTWTYDLHAYVEEMK